MGLQSKANALSPLPPTQEKHERTNDRKSNRLCGRPEKALFPLSPSRTLQHGCRLSDAERYCGMSSSSLRANVVLPEDLLNTVVRGLVSSLVADPSSSHVDIDALLRRFFGILELLVSSASSSTPAASLPSTGDEAAPREAPSLSPVVRDQALDRRRRLLQDIDSELQDMQQLLSSLLGNVH